VGKEAPDDAGQRESNEPRRCACRPYLAHDQWKKQPFFFGGGANNSAGLRTARRPETRISHPLAQFFAAVIALII